MAHRYADPPFSVDDILTTLSTWADNFHRNTSKAFTDLRPRDYIRLVVIIGAYCLLRPYLMKIGAKIQASEHEKANRRAEEEAQTRLSANDLRGAPKMAIPGVESDSDEDDEQEATNWGRKAKIRQRNMIRKKLEEHEEMLRQQQPPESDDDIAEFLVD